MTAPTLPEADRRERIEDLVESGAIQISRKYRRVFTPPKGGSVAWLRENDPERYDRLVESCLKRFEEEANSTVYAIACFASPSPAPYNVTVQELDESEFNYFRELTTGRKPWSPEGKEHCPGCGSLGHMHRRGCSALKAPAP